MKFNIIYIVAALAVMTVSCSKKEGVANGDSDQPNGPVHTERIGLVLADNPGTKVNVDGTTGAITWIQDTDQIAVCVRTNTSSYAYRTCPVNGDSSIEVDLANNQTRDLYAIYPATSAVTNYDGKSNTYPLRIQYPSTYDLSAFDTLEKIANYCPSPMVAINDGSEVLSFYHAGGVLRMNLTDVPKGTNRIIVRSYGVNIYGTYTVVNPGTKDMTLTQYSGSTSVTFNINSELFADNKHNLTLNVPIPAVDYTGFQRITISYWDSTNNIILGGTYYAPESSVWVGSVRSLGRKLNLAFEQSSFGGYLISGFVYNSDFTLSYEDRDELIPYKRSKESFRNMYFGSYNMISSFNDPLHGYVKPSTTDLSYIFAQPARRAGSTVGEVQNCKYATVTVSGVDNSVYGTTSVSGVIYFPDSGEIGTGSGITYFNSGTSNPITYSQFINLIQTPPYCIFIPVSANYGENSHGEGTTKGPETWYTGCLLFASGTRTTVRAQDVVISSGSGTGNTAHGYSGNDAYWGNLRLVIPLR